MNTNHAENFNNMSLQELIDLLLIKTKELIDTQENQIDSLKFQNLLLEVEQLHDAIKAKRQKDSI